MSQEMEAKVAALEAALGSGELTVESQGDRVTYRSIKDLREALAYFTEKLAASQRAAGRGDGFGFSAPSFTRD
ncbi:MULTISPECIES: phage head-tail joining protein [Brevundimonas]|uniref:GpW n=1 Tax=Brevundimonas vancanneytii TaxID=1325724 RepID=A0A4P1JRD0_9CAUL|nr:MULTISPECIES: hypothetical protein [Brevundimonas]VTO10675.1 Uncharacterised protein [Brevundimonas vancanneytii]